MKKRTFVMILVVLFAFGGLIAQDKPESVDKIMKEAYKKAAKEDKNVFVMFTASWCGWCHRMDSLMSMNSTKKMFDDNYVIEHIVVSEYGDNKILENPGGEEFRKKYKGDKLGIPYWLVFDNKGKVLADARMKEDGSIAYSGEGTNSGSPATKEEVEYFIKVLKETSSLNAKELDLVTKVFTLNR